MSLLSAAALVADADNEEARDEDEALAFDDDGLDDEEGPADEFDALGTPFLVEAAAIAAAADALAGVLPPPGKT